MSSSAAAAAAAAAATAARRRRASKKMEAVMLDDTDTSDLIEVPRAEPESSRSPSMCCCQCRPSQGCGSVHRVLHKVTSNFRMLPGRFWLLCMVQLFASYAYFATALQMTTFLTGTMRETDQMSASIYGYYGLAASVWTFFAGPLSDVLGAKPLLVAAPLVGTIGRALAIMASTSGLGLQCPPWVIYVAIIALISFGDGILFLAVNTMATQILKTGGAQRKVAFGILYSFQNIGAMIAGVGLDVTTLLQHTYTGSLWTGLFDVSQSVLICATLSALITLVFACFVASTRLKTPYKRAVAMKPLNVLAAATGTTKKRDSAVSEGEDDDDDAAADTNETVSANRSARCSYAIGTVTTCSFWRFCAFSLCCVGVKMVFRQFDMTFPTYMRRTFGPDAPIGLMYAIDPMLIIVLAPLAQSLTAEFSPMRWIVVGAWITAFSVMLLAFSTPNMLGLFGVVFFGVMLAVGESFWSPRLNDYAADVAGKSRVGIYLAATSPILFLSKFPAGWLSGWLLTRYCPSDPVQGPCDTIALWMVIGMVTMASSPLLLTLFYNLIYDPVVRRRWNETQLISHDDSRDEARKTFESGDGDDDDASLIIISDNEEDTIAATLPRHSGNRTLAASSSSSSSSASTAKNQQSRPAARVHNFDVTWDAETDAVAAIIRPYASDAD